SAGIDVSLRLFLRAVETCAFQNNVYVKFFPRKVLSFLFSVDLDFLAVYCDCTSFFVSGYCVSKSVSSLSGIVLQQVSQHLGACKVVDSNNFVSFSTKHLSECKTTNTSKSVNC